MATALSPISPTEERERLVRTVLPSVSAKPQVVTPTMATHWLAEYPFDLQRRMEPGHAANLADELARDAWFPTAIQLARCGDKIYLLDGQHRLKAITIAGKPAVLVVVWVEMETVEEVAAAYAKIDQNKTRSLANILVSTQAHEKAQLSPHQMQRAISATTLIAHGFDPTLLSYRRTFAANRARRIRWAQAWSAEVRAYYETQTGASTALHQSLRNAACMAVGLVTFRHQPEAAKTFWTQVAQNDALKRGTPEQRAVEILLTDTGDRSGNGVLLHAREIAGCWNGAFVHRESGFRLHLRTVSDPIFIAGTPFTGKEVYQYDEPV